jgi:hypothetical protein
MKKILLLATAFAFTLGAMAQPKADDVIKVNVDKHDFGKVIQGTPVTYSFEIKNTSDKPVVVENTWASCGCTTPEKIVDPIMPGNTAQLKVQYNAANAAPFTKDVYIKLSGIEQPKTVQITGEVLTADAFAAYTKDNKSTKEVTPPVVKPAATKETPKTNTPGTQPKFSKATGN